ncbi:TPM domain-containing protein [Comamonas composti]|uniref:TPM domain-containing protein n=1 Tax=Comamonas composti TaxID=408558 RepID=UPI0004112D35|nr:TPM domain-containing protein [Comamonas composti]
MQRLFSRVTRLVRHRLAEPGLERQIPRPVLDRLEQAITASEATHTGQIRICIEAGLPWSYIWRDATAHERALSQFGKLRVWDTEHNNGVLIYLLLADHAIEIVADRALERSMTTEHWQTLISDMGSAFRAGHYELGLLAALERVSHQLSAHFPQPAGTPGLNELPDTPIVKRHV